MIDLNPYFTDFASLAGLVLLLTGWLNTHLLKWSGQKAQILSWVLAIGLAAAAKWQGIGVFGESNWLWIALQGVGAGLIANGMYSVDVIKTILGVIKAVGEKKASVGEKKA
jgi:hypothetical protein